MEPGVSADPERSRHASSVTPGRVLDTGWVCLLGAWSAGCCLQRAFKALKLRAFQKTTSPPIFSVDLRRVWTQSAPRSGGKPLKALSENWIAGNRNRSPSLLCFGGGA